MKQNWLFKNLILAVQGAIVGTGAILPGVSGGVLLWPLVFMSR